MTFIYGKMQVLTHGCLMYFVFFRILQDGI